MGETCSLLYTDSYHHMFSYLTHPPALGTLNPVVRQLLQNNLLAFSSWKANLTDGNLGSFHKARNKCMSILRGATKQHQSNHSNALSNLSSSSKTWWCLVKSVSAVCFPSIPSLTSNGTTADSAREKAECFNSVFLKTCVPHSSLFLSVSHPSQSYPTAPEFCFFSPEKVEMFLATLD